MTKLLPHVEVETAADPTASIIWLHGLGADGHDFEPIVTQLPLPKSAAIRFIFPHAPSRPVTINSGLVMPAWYDIVELSIEKKPDIEGLQSSVNQITKFIKNEIRRGIKSERIIIAGFSQGGAVAFELALSYPKKLAGLLALSTYFATKDSISFNPANAELPIAIHHGRQDPIVPHSLAKVSSELLSNHDYKVELTSYNMEHSLCHEQVNDIGKWFSKILNL